MMPSSCSSRSRASAGRVVAVAVAQALLAELAEVVLGRLLAGRLERGELALAEVEALVVVLDQLGDPRPRWPGPPRGRASRRTSPRGCGRRTGRSRTASGSGRRRVLPVLMQSRTSWAGGVLAGQVVGVAGGHERQAQPVGDVDGALGAVALDLRGRCSGSRRRSSPRRRPSGTRSPELLGLGRLAVQDVGRRTRPRRSPTGRSAPRCAARGSPCRSAACSRTLPGTTSTRAASGCGTPRRCGPGASGGRRTPRPSRRPWSARSAGRGRRRPRSRRSA